jgi:amidophosphoribosyltransferase
LIYQDLEDLRSSAREGNPKIADYEDSVFSGEYVTGDVNAAYLEDLEASRNDVSKGTTVVKVVSSDA